MDLFGFGDALGQLGGLYLQKQQAKQDAKVATAQAKAAAAAARATEAQALLEAAKLKNAQAGSSQLQAGMFGNLPPWALPVLAVGLVLAVVARRD